MKIWLVQSLATASVATSLRVTPRFSFLQTGAAAGVAMLCMSGAAKATIEVGGMTIQAGGMTKLGKEGLMSQKAHGTSPYAVQAKLRWNADRATADRICSFNRHYAENAGCARSDSNPAPAGHS